jgi:hypothetical protein
MIYQWGMMYKDISLVLLIRPGNLLYFVNVQVLNL